MLASLLRIILLTATLKILERGLDKGPIILIERNYNKWQFDWRDFESEKIQEIVCHTLNNFNEYLYYLSDKYMRLLPSNPDFLICKNQSIEEGERLREELRPNFIRIREELRDRYLELWPAKAPTPK